MSSQKLHKKFIYHKIKSKSTY